MRRRIASSRFPLHAGFTLVEAVVATAITAMAGSALLLGVSSALMTTHEAERQAVALGLAQQLLDEVAGADVYHPSERTATVITGGNRQPCDDVDDYHGIVCQPPLDPWGIRLGEDDGQGGKRHPAFFVPTDYLGRWCEEIEVYFVDETTFARLPTGQVSDCRMIEVRVSYVDPDRGPRELAKLRQVISYVPPLP